MKKYNINKSVSHDALIAVCMSCLLLALAFSTKAAPLKPGTPILLPGTQGKFDFIRLDADKNRLLMGHEGNKSFDIFDLTTGKLLKVCPTGTSQDAAVDANRGCYYVSGNDPGRMLIVDAGTLEITGTVPAPANTDLIGFDPLTGLVYESNDNAGQVWVIDPVSRKIVTTIKMDGTGVEDLTFDTGYKHLYQAVKGTNSIAVIDPASNKVLQAWPCAPDKGAHGIAYATDINGLLVACAGKLLLFDCVSGKLVATVATGDRVDEIAYDPEMHTAYCASRGGIISVASVEAGRLTAVGDIPDQPGTGDIAVDPKTHTVWIAYKQDDQCFVQPFTTLAVTGR
jgi:DNA-binding beta-propeller fold protein YncE